MSGTVWEAFPDVREWSKDYPECPGVVRRHSRMSKCGRRPTRVSRSGRKACRMAGSVRKAIPNVR